MWKSSFLALLMLLPGEVRQPNSTRDTLSNIG